MGMTFMQGGLDIHLNSTSIKGEQSKIIFSLDVDEAWLVWGDIYAGGARYPLELNKFKS